MTAIRAWEYIRDHLLSETACGDLEPDGKLALTTVEFVIMGDIYPDKEYGPEDFESQ
jgi:hypothetical protein